MTDAPATIWATGNKTTGSWNHTPLSLRIAPVQTEYVRADIAASQFISVLPEAQFAAFAAAVDADVESPADISQARIAQLEAALHEIRTALDYEVEYNDQGMGCGIEDRGITDRYEAMSFGWDSAEDRYNSEVIQCADEIACAALKAKP